MVPGSDGSRMWNVGYDGNHRDCEIYTYVYENDTQISGLVLVGTHTQTNTQKKHDTKRNTPHNGILSEPRLSGEFTRTHENVMGQNGQWKGCATLWPVRHCDSHRHQSRTAGNGYIATAWACWIKHTFYCVFVGHDSRRGSGCIRCGNVSADVCDTMLRVFDTTAQ